MKKRHYLGIYILALGTVVTSCNDILDKETHSHVTEEGLGTNVPSDTVKFKTAALIEKQLTAAYNSFSSPFGQLGNFIANDAQSDNAYAGEPKDQSKQFDEFRIVSENGTVKEAWQEIYKQIAQTNSVIQWAPLVPDVKLTDVRKKEIVAEASFIRALGYFNLVRLFGDVPLITKEIPSISNANLVELLPLLFPQRTSKDSVYLQIVKDLEYAVEFAPSHSTFKFKATKAVANLVLAQVYATKNGFAGTDWKKVKQYSQAVVDNSNYELLPNYDDLFAAPLPPVDGRLPITNLTNEHSKESLFEIDYTGNQGLGNWGATMFFGVDWKKFNTPSHDLVKAFDDEKDIIRKNASIRFENITSWTDNFWPLENFPLAFKQRAREEGNVILFRLPEAILLLAEAENELGNTANATNLLNKIRSRVKLPNTTATSKEGIRLAIEKEYRLEFAFEGKRWLDLVRRGRAIQVMQAASDHQREYAKQNLNENRLIWPIPQTEIGLNNKLTQNPGY